VSGQPITRLGRRGGGIVPCLFHDIDPASKHRFDDLVLRREVVVERSRPDADPCRDLALRDAGDPVFEDELGGGVQDPLANVAGRRRERGLGGNDDRDAT
jgi:hypothetical protein